eukprot:gnl/MRDRNA2_/MRDRNA2_270098_c0_seq1.p3 gnl/MRDRNA2_/MRDRNA2_270098_c0~~gnl/MRDRNA2_/MRDRNA2_270098_c0_seq1.p3  ORF type:complete len:123 (+),score=16.89 gnl/MRDRNA2_/MRDRNA2_270098_c0_seq1:210-578(+)
MPSGQEPVIFFSKGGLSIGIYLMGLPLLCLLVLHMELQQLHVTVPSFVTALLEMGADVGNFTKVNVISLAARGADGQTPPQSPNLVGRVGLFMETFMESVRLVRTHYRKRSEILNRKHLFTS